MLLTEIGSVFNLKKIMRHIYIYFYTCSVGGGFI